MIDTHTVLTRMSTILDLCSAYPHIAEVSEIIALCNETLHDAGWNVKHGNVAKPVEPAECFVVATGNAFDGVKLQGPFGTLGEALHYGEGCDPGTWHMVRVEAPDVQSF